jgi:hypothetical protein
MANIATPGVEIQQAMTKVRAQVNEETNKGQLPWGHTNLIGSVYLNPVAAPAAGAAAPAVTGSTAVASTSGGSDVELEFWRSVKESNKPEELNAYLTNYPNGQFRSLALARIASLESAPSTATRTLAPGIDPATFTEAASQTTEDQIGLDKGKRRDVQRRLTGLGFDTKLTGVFDDPTRAVITRWQAARGYPQSGFLNKLQHKALLTEIVAVAPTAAREAPVERQARPAPARSSASAPPPPAQRGPDPALIVTSAPEIQKPGSHAGLFYALDDPRRGLSGALRVPFGQLQQLVAARGQQTHLHFLARRNRLGAGDLRIVGPFGRLELAGHDAGGIAGERIRDQDARHLLPRQDHAVERHRFRQRRRCPKAGHHQSNADEQPSENSELETDITRMHRYSF